MTSKMKSVSPMEIKLHDEMQSWKRFQRRFKLAAVAIKFSDIEVSEDADKETARLEQEQYRKGVQMLREIGEEGMKIFDTFNMEVEEVRFDDLQERFTTHFEGRENTTILRHRFFNAKQKEGEEISEYILRMEGLGAPCKLEPKLETMVTHMVINGMRDNKVRNEVLREVDLDLKKLKAIATRVESAERTGEELDRDVKYQGIERVKERRDINLRSFDRNQGEERVRRPFRCYRCDKEGHFSRECREKLECYNCGDNHLARFCNKKNTSRPQIRCYKCGKEGHISTRCTSEGNGSGTYRKTEGRPVGGVLRYSEERGSIEEPL